ncbi:NAD-dependent epimerase/dehydratase family protein [Microbacterium sp. CFH 31415]|uniref:NAD-dependent epimerase/dehydratase family protein n=1 Tax=Microbacterium sp. CFH 31415 TaxID=2921732 RepID=UPI001F13A75F|nr:NAD-dependent epimerase/dehydratase family protein [Microbacterium sp. CFH 31415]MCH6231590.1 NAD-dependent epimerase/dehydratase family protein [Microbacterium sp. CFH 31415]
MTRRTTLVVGGSGLIGSQVVAELVARGRDVVVAGRHGARPDDPASIAGLPRLVGDYADGGLSTAELRSVDEVVMAAGQDIRHVEASDEDGAFWDRVQRRGVPALAERARDAGVARFVQIGSYYHQYDPSFADRIAYVAARRDADERTRALTSESFAAITLNPPSIVGAATERARRRFARMAESLRGEGERPAAWAPPGGTGYMSVRSLAQAVAGALDRGEPGRAYLVGDESLSYREYFQLIVDVSGGSNRIGVQDAEHPLQPDRFIVQGRGATIAYEPGPDVVDVLRFDRRDVRRALAEILGDAPR